MNHLVHTLTLDNVIEVEKFARDLSIQELVTKSSRLLRYNFFKISKCSDFLDLEENEIESLLCEPDLNADEHQVWNATMRWLRHKSSRSASFPRLVRKIRIGLFEESFFIKEFMPEVCRFRPWDFETDSLLNEAQHFYQTLRSVTEETPPLVTPTSAIPRLPQDVVLAIQLTIEGTYSPCLTLLSYDIWTDRWTRVPVKGFLDCDYLDCKAAVVGNKVFFIHPGRRRECCHLTLNTTCFDVEQQTLTPLSPLQGRWDFGVAALNGYVYVIGGTSVTPLRQRLNTVARFDPAKNQWTMVAPMTTCRAWPQCAVINGEIYVAGGLGLTDMDILTTVEVYNPQENKWRHGTDIPPRLLGFSCVAFDEKLLVIGGSTDIDGDTQYFVSSCMKYDPVTNECSQMPN